ncbi:MAG: LuxR family transcriptional regulator, partial [Nocardioidaceae bacterium]|nr:LuxR family transcriptional regulator [Nocardioidaceae bacterium]
MGGDLERRTQDKVARLAGEGHDWVTLSTRLSAVIAGVIPFTRTCWHTVDPGTVLFTGSLNREIKCSGSWLAEHEYVIDDINRWWFLARGQTHVGASSLATHGDLSRSARHRSREGYGTGDELRASFVVDGVYWGAAGFLREEGDLWFTEAEVRLLATMCSAVAEGLRRALLAVPPAVGVPSAGMDAGPGLVVYDEHGDPELISSAA